MVRIVRRVAPPPSPPLDPGYEPLPARRRGPILLSDWTPADLGPHEEQVEAYSNADRVELVLNGRSLGALTRNADLAPRVWNVPFAPGLLRAIASMGGHVVATHELRTAGKPARIVLAADRARIAQDWDDVSHVTLQIVDEKGVVVPSADALVTFAISGPGALVALDNADTASHEPFQATQRRVHNGRCLALVRATAPSGRIVLEASARGLAGASVSLEAVLP
jgi:beta-galactosidase